MSSNQSDTTPPNKCSSSTPDIATRAETSFDAFTLYSDDKLRMKKLLMKDNNSDQCEQDSSDSTTSAVPSAASGNATLNGSTQGTFHRPTGTYSFPVKEGSPATTDRKTRISFEVHPSLLLEDLVLSNDEMN